MNNLKKEIELMINKELYHKEVINFLEFKMLNELLLGEQK